jgi:alkyl hydroperoxide reductase subunit AhpC
MLCAAKTCIAVGTALQKMFAASQRVDLRFAEWQPQNFPEKDSNQPSLECRNCSVVRVSISRRFRHFTWHVARQEHSAILHDSKRLPLIVERQREHALRAFFNLNSVAGISGRFSR